MKTTTACSECTLPGSRLYVGIKSSDKKWKLAFATSPEEKARLRNADA